MQSNESRLNTEPLKLRQRTVEAPPAPPRSGERKPRLRASVDEPRLVHLPSFALQPIVPEPLSAELPLIAGAQAAPEPPALTSPEQLRRLMEKMVADAEQLQEGAASAEAKRDASAEDRRAEETDQLADRQLFGTPLAEEEVIFDRARTCLEELATFGLMRKPIEGQSWAGRSTTERRLLARIDAIFSLGEAVLPRLLQLWADRPIPDPELTWAALFLFGSIAGDAALDQVMQIARLVSFESPEMLEGVADALSLAPHPGIAAAIRSWLGDAEPARRAVALKVLRRRRAITSAEALRCAADSELAVVGAAAEALGAAAGAVDARRLDELLHHQDEAVVRAAMESAVIRRSPLFIRRARKLVEGGLPSFAQAATFLAIGSEARDADLFVAAANRQTSPELLEAAGWFGHPQVIDLLLRSMRSPEESVNLAAAGALQRITGASLTEEEPDPQYDHDDRPFLRAFAPPPIMAKLLLDADAWTAWWKKHQGNCKPSLRYRYGHPWSPEDNLWQMEDPLSPRASRWAAHLELSVRTGETIPFDPDAFVSQQLKHIQQWRDVSNSRRAQAGVVGGWPLRLGG